MAHKKTQKKSPASKHGTKKRVSLRGTIKAGGKRQRVSLRGTQEDLGRTKSGGTRVVLRGTERVRGKVKKRSTAHLNPWKFKPGHHATSSAAAPKSSTRRRAAKKTASRRNHHGKRPLAGAALAAHERALNAKIAAAYTKKAPKSHRGRKHHHSTRMAVPAAAALRAGKRSARKGGTPSSRRAASEIKEAVASLYGKTPKSKKTAAHKAPKSRRGHHGKRPLTGAALAAHNRKLAHGTTAAAPKSKRTHHAAPKSHRAGPKSSRHGKRPLAGAALAAHKKSLAKKARAKTAAPKSSRHGAKSRRAHHSKRPLAGAALAAHKKSLAKKSRAKTAAPKSSRRAAPKSKRKHHSRKAPQSVRRIVEGVAPVSVKSSRRHHAPKSSRRAHHPASLRSVGSDVITPSQMAKLKKLVGKRRRKKGAPAQSTLGTIGGYQFGSLPAPSLHLGAYGGHTLGGKRKMSEKQWKARGGYAPRSKRGPVSSSSATTRRRSPITARTRASLEAIADMPQTMRSPELFTVGPQTARGGYGIPSVHEYEGAPVAVRAAG